MQQASATVVFFFHFFSAIFRFGVDLYVQVRFFCHSH